jgi:hypothetical protein
MAESKENQGYCITTLEGDGMGTISSDEQPPLQQEPESTGPHQPSDELNENVYEILRSEIHAVKSFVQETKTNNEENTRIQKRNLLVTSFTALIVMVYTAVTYCLLSATQEANRTSRDSLIASTRPWIGIDNPVGVVEDFEDGKTPYFPIALYNFGRSPGFKVVLICKTSPIISEKEWVNPSIKSLVGDIQFLESELWNEEHGGQPVPATWEIGTLWPEQKHKSLPSMCGDKPLAAGAVSDVQRGIGLLVMVGVIIYHDERGGPHHTWIEIRYAPRHNRSVVTHPYSAPPDN